LPAITVLRTLVFAEIALLVASVLTIFLPDETPPAIDEYLAGPGAGPLWLVIDGELTPVSYLLGAALVVFVGIYVASLVGLLLLKPWSRRLYVISFAAGVCLHPFMGSSFVDPISATVEYLLAACSGAILATMFLSEARESFGRTI
jgi:hypothetical protein